MKYVFISDYYMSSYVSLYLKKYEKKEIGVIVNNDDYKDILSGILEKDDNYAMFLDQGNIFVMDYQKQGKLADTLRGMGELVFGGPDKSDSIEKDRDASDRVLRAYGLNVPESTSYKDSGGIEDAIKFLEKNKGRWCVKQNGDNAKSLNAIGKFEDATDLIDKLKDYKHVWLDDISFQLQKFKKGHEVAVTGYFNGVEWITDKDGDPVFILNFEHKKLNDGDTGVSTGEVCTLSVRASKESKVAQELIRLTPYLQKIKYKGVFDVNFILDENGTLWALEPSPRMGWPAMSLHIQSCKSEFAQLISDVAKGENSGIVYDPRWCVTVKIQVPPFPYEAIKPYNDAKGQRIYFLKNGEWIGKDHIPPEKLKFMHMREVKFNKETEHFECTGSTGDLMDITALGDTVPEANDLALERIKDNIETSNMTWRKDCGVNQRVTECIEFMKKGGYL